MNGVGENLQQTIQRPVVCEGIGLHSGDHVSLRLCPSAPNSGITFARRTQTGAVTLAAHVSQVSQTRLATSLGRGEQAVHTVEHLLAALSGMRIDNLLIELSASEVPIMDGSAQPFVDAILEAGVVEQPAARSLRGIVRPFEIREGDAWMAASPGFGLVIHNTVDYDHPAIGRQIFEYRDQGPAAFAETLAAARTFGFLHDVEQLKASGLIQGGGLHNAVVVGPQGVLNREGLRWPDEFVRHKTLDLLGDLALLGGPLQGRITAYKAGHRLHAKFVASLAAHTEVLGAATVETEQSDPAAVLAGK